MADTGKIAKNLERFAQAVAAHDRENPTHTAYGIGLAHFDMERLGLEEGEEILPGITIHADSGVTGNFRVLCDGEHDEELTEAEEQAVEAIATQSIPRVLARALAVRSSSSRRSSGPTRPRPWHSTPRSRLRGDRAPAIIATSRSIVGQREAVARGRAQHRAGDRVELGRAPGGDVALHRAAERGVGALELGDRASRGRRRARPRRSPTAQASSIAPTRSARSAGVERISPSSLS